MSLSWSLVVKGEPRCQERESPAVPETEKGKKVKAKRLQFLGGGRILRLRWKLAQSLYDKPRETYYFLIIKVRYENKVVVWASGLGGGGGGGGRGAGQGYTTPFFLIWRTWSSIYLKPVGKYCCEIPIGNLCLPSWKDLNDVWRRLQLNIWLPSLLGKNDRVFNLLKTSWYLSKMSEIYGCKTLY